MSRIVSRFDWTGMQVNGIILGSPLVEDDWFIWDHDMFSSGAIDEEGNIVYDSIDEGDE